MGVLGGEIHHLAGGDRAPHARAGPVQVIGQIPHRAHARVHSARNSDRYPATNTADDAIATSTSAIDHRSSGSAVPASSTSSMILEIVHGSRIQAAPETLQQHEPGGDQAGLGSGDVQRYRQGSEGMSAGDRASGRSGLGSQLSNVSAALAERQADFRSKPV